LIQYLKNPVLLKIFFLRFLPMAMFAGLRLDKLETTNSIVSVPFKWLTKNPFKSMYFAVQSMAAEFSTAVLLAGKIQETKSDIALIIVSLRADFIKKAQSRITFTCEDGLISDEVIQNALTSESAELIEMKSVGLDKSGVKVSEFYITWSLKKRSRQKA
jgi:hypothetical protein